MNNQNLYKYLSLKSIVAICNYIIVCFILLSSSLKAQSNIAKKYKLADSTYSYVSNVIKTSDGGFLIIGQNAFNNSSYLIIIKTNDSGDTLWTQNIHCINILQAIPRCAVELINSQGYIIAGYLFASSTLSYGFLLRLDTNGNILWFKKIYSSEFCSCINSLDGNILLTAYSFFNPAKTYLLMKITPSGNVNWIKGITDVIATSITNHENIVQLSDSTIILCGSTQLQIGNNIQYVRNFIGKFSDNGNLLWARTYGDSLTIIQPNSISYDNLNHLILAGRHTLTPSGQTIGYLMCVDTTGNLVWYREYDGLSYDIGGIVKANVLANGEIYALKRKNSINGSVPQFFKTNSNGSPLWNKIIFVATNEEIYFKNFIETSNIGFALCGGFRVIGSPYEMALTTTDSSGNFNCSWIDTLITSSTITISTQIISPNVSSISLNDSAQAYFETSGIILSDYCTGTGTNELDNISHDISVFPNPTNCSIFIQANPIKQIEFILSNSMGQEIISKSLNITSPTNQIQVTNLADGIYFWKAISRGEILANGKIIIIK